MALTKLQRHICQLLAERRKARGESYVAGGVALNELLNGSRRSQDIDLFHDTEQAVQISWDEDRALLLANGFTVRTLRERPSFVEALISLGNEEVLVQWAQDSAFRFFPLIEHPLLGLALHPFDLATNKVLALVGRREARDWIDVLRCDEQVQPFGYLAWAAAGKDPGYGPLSIIEEAARSVRYTQIELDALDFAEPPPNAASLAQRWHVILAEARRLLALLPAEHAGTCVVSDAGDLVRASSQEVEQRIAAGSVRFHSGRIGGALPELKIR